MMLYVEYEKTGEGFTASLNLYGDMNGLRGLADALIDFGKLPTVMELNREHPPSPYDGLLKEISIALKPSAKVYIGQEGGRRIISGSQECLSILADNIRHLVEHPIPSTGVPRHIHIEYYADHFYFGKGSIPLVVALAD